MPRDEIRMEVREEDMPDAAAQLRCALEIAIDVALRIHDRGLAALLLGDQVGGVGQAGQIVPLQDHAPSPLMPP
jgi:hypothetical protein